MADFTVTGDLDPRLLLEGLKSFERQAAVTASRAGESFTDAFGKKVGGSLPSSLQKALQSSGSAAQSAGGSIGSGLVSGLGKQVSTGIPSTLQKALSGAASGVSSSGKAIGAALSGSLGTSLGTSVPAVVRQALANSNGQQLGSGLGRSIGSGLDSTLPPAFQRVFLAGETTARTSGTSSSQAFGQNFKQGLDRNRALFANIVSQAQKAAQQVGLVFNTVKLRFETPKGEIVPQRELDKLARLSPALASAQASLSQFGASTGNGAAGMQRLGQQFDSAGEQSGILQAAITGLAFSLTNSLTNAAGAAVNALGGLVGHFIELDHEIRLATVAAGETGAYDRLNRAIEEVAMQCGGSTIQIAQLATSLVRAGYTVDQVTMAMPGIAKGAQATGTSFEEMGSIVGNTLRGFGLQVTDTARVNDVLIKAANTSNASVTSLGETFKYAAPVAKTLGISLEDLGATAGLMANAGIDATVAGTGLRFGLMRLQKAAAGASGESLGLSVSQVKLTKAIRLLGAEVTNANGTLKPMDQVFIAMKDSLSKLSVAAQIELASAIFGDEAGSKFLSVTNQSDKAIQDMFGSIRSSKGAADEAAAGMDAIGKNLGQLKAGLETLGNSFGMVVSAALLPFVKAAQSLVQALVSLPVPVRAAGAALTLLAGGYIAAKIAAIAFRQAISSTVFSQIIGEITTLGSTLRDGLSRDVAMAVNAWRRLQAALGATNAQAAANGLAKVTNGLRTLNAAQVANGLQQGLKALGNGALSASQKLSQLVNNGVRGLSSGLGNAAIGVSTLGNKLRNMAAASQMAETGMKGTTALLQRGMTTGATSAATAATGLSRVLSGLASLTSGGLAAGFASAAVAMAPLLIALAAIVPAVIGYNQVMSQSRQLTASIGPIVSNYGKELDKAGIKYQDLGKSGGPIAEMTRKVGDAFRDSGKFIKESAEKLKQWGPLGALAAGGLKILGAAMMSMPWMQFLRGIQWVIDKTKEAYREAGRNQAIIEAADQMEQAEVQFQATGNSIIAFTEKLKGMGAIAPASVGAVTTELNRNRQAANASIGTFKNLAAQFRLLAEAARLNNNPELAAQYEQQALIAENNVKIAARQLAALDAEANKRGIVKEKLKEQSDGVALLTEKFVALNKAITNNSNQLEMGQAMLGLGKALADLEQSRFSISRSRAQYEIEQAEKLGASEGQLAKKRQALQIMDAQALHARYQAMLQQQALEVQLLNLSQQKAMNEANLAGLQARLEMKKAEQALAAAQSKGDQEAIANATLDLQLKSDGVDLAQQKVGLLQQMQPIEAAIAQAARETAINGLQSEAAGKGWSLALDGVYRTAQAVAPVMAANAQQMGGMSVSAKRAADGSIVLTQNTQKAAAPMAQLGSSANQAATAMNGLSVQAYRAADGTIVIRNKAVEASNATKDAAVSAGNLSNSLVVGAGKGIDLEKAIRGSGSSLSTAAISGSQLSSQLDRGEQAAQGMGDGSKAVATSLQNAAAPAKAVTDNVAAGEQKGKGLAEAMDKGQRNTGAAASSAGNLDRAMKGATNLAQTFQKTDLNGMLSRASGSAGGLSGAMAKAASSAQAFYSWLAKASGLPGSRWSGGPVEAGQRYRINELGQEAFLSGGKLSLIRQPRNALWTAPTAGLVIPAGMTADLKSRGVFSPGGEARARVSGHQMVRGSSTEQRDQAALLARQAIAIGKLQQSVDRLVDKDWKVHVKVRNDAGGSSHLNALNRMR